MPVQINSSNTIGTRMETATGRGLEEATPGSTVIDTAFTA